VSNLSFYRLHSSLPSPVVLHQSLLFSPHSGGLTFQFSPQQCVFSMSLPVIPPARSASACGSRGTDLNSASKGQYSRVRFSTYFGRHNIHAAHTRNRISAIRPKSSRLGFRTSIHSQGGALCPYDKYSCSAI
jgi:hypothetical protein